jgi:hypothetical protein
MSKTNEELALEVQELRQFCVQMLLGIGMKPGETNGDYWWDKLTAYEDVKNG